MNSPYTLSADQIDFYQKNRFIKLKEVLNQESITFFNKVIADQVALMNQEQTALADRSTYGKAFLQLFNLWLENPLIKELVFSKRIAQIATALMETDGVRLYHDQALFKESGGGITPWHADQYYWPLETDKTITAWIPLQETPLPMGPLEFSAGSHVIVEGRELESSSNALRLSPLNFILLEFGGDVRQDRGGFNAERGFNGFPQIGKTKPSEVFKTSEV